MPRVGENSPRDEADQWTVQDRSAVQSRPDQETLVPVLVVDDEASFRAVMRDVVAAAPGFRVAGQAASGEEAVEAVEELAPRLVIMDKRMPGMGGIEACRAITERNPEIIVLLCSVEDPDPRLARECGAAGMTPKQYLSPRLLDQVWRGASAV
jgi:DNA-binding NarL/FixJ family response regulator